MDSHEENEEADRFTEAQICPSNDPGLDFSRQLQLFSKSEQTDEQITFASPKNSLKRKDKRTKECQNPNRIFHIIADKAKAVEKGFEFQNSNEKV